MAHVAFLTDFIVEDFKDIISQLGDPQEVTIQFARSMQAYEVQYQAERFLDPDMLDPETYFNEQDVAYPTFFKTHFSECTINTTISEMLNCIIVIDNKGAIHYLEQYPVGSVSVAYVSFEYDADDEAGLSDQELDTSIHHFFNGVVRKRSREEIESVEIVSESVYKKGKC